MPDLPDPRDAVGSGFPDEGLVGTDCGGCGDDISTRRLVLVFVCVGVLMALLVWASMGGPFDAAPQACKDAIERERQAGTLDLNRRFPRECRGYGSDF